MQVVAYQWPRGLANSKDKLIEEFDEEVDHKKDELGNMKNNGQEVDGSLFQAYARDQRWRDFAKLPTPAKRSKLRMFRRKGAFLEAVKNKSVLEGEVHIILKRTVEIQLRFWLVTKRQPVRLELIDITRYFHRITCLNLTII